MIVRREGSHGFVLFDLHGFRQNITAWCQWVRGAPGEVDSVTSGLSRRSNKNASRALFRHCEALAENSPLPLWEYPGRNQIQIPGSGHTTFVTEISTNQSVDTCWGAGC